MRLISRPGEPAYLEKPAFAREGPQGNDAVENLSEAGEER